MDTPDQAELAAILAKLTTARRIKPKVPAQKYLPHQGERERARRLKQLARQKKP